MLCDLFALKVQLCYCALKTAAKCNKEYLELLQRQSLSDMLRASGVVGKAVSVEFFTSIPLSRRTAPGLLLPYEVTPSDKQECFCSHVLLVCLSASTRSQYCSPLLSLLYSPSLALLCPLTSSSCCCFLPQKHARPRLSTLPPILFFILHLPLIPQCLLHFFSFFLPWPYVLSIHLRSFPPYVSFAYLSACAPPPPLPSPSRLVSPITVQRAEARVSLCLLTWAHWAKPRTSPAQPRGREPPALPR